MEEFIREFSGRAFSLEDIEKIKWTRKVFPKLSERELACTICETLGWVTIKGLPKRQACVEFLRLLASEGIIELPESRRTNNLSACELEQKADNRANALPDNVEEIITTGDIELEVVQAGTRMQLLCAYLRKYHYLGDKAAYGDKLHYFIKDSNGTLLGCMRFSAASWVLSGREEWIGWTAAQKKARLFLIVNQSRYLIFPYVHIRNLSSRALSLATKRLPADWLERYYYEPVLIETFVDTDLYKGTSYLAANWTLIGQTKGRGRNDRYGEYSFSVKDIYMYPLRRDFREILTGKKTYRAVDPDVY
jgi:hypothetical protein